MPNPSDTIHALLIGIDCYMKNELPDGGYYPSLGGCVRDSTRMADFLRGRLGVPAERIAQLTASVGPGGKPKEPTQAWPTYENIVNAWKRLLDRAKPGEQVFVHYSGHGGRSVTAFPELKGPKGVDESLVPTDIGFSEQRYVRDLEIAHLLRAMVEKKLLVTVVFDSCHSGGATRGIGGAVARGIGKLDTTPSRKPSQVASAAELADTWRALDAGTRALKPAGGWLAEPKGYVFLSACRASESALEYAFGDEGRSGALTYWLLDALSQIGPGAPWKRLHEHVLAKVHGMFKEQTPQLQGEGDRLAFGSGAGELTPAIVVLEVDGDRVRVNAGQAHGLRSGARLSLHPADDLALTAERRIAIAEIVELGAAESWAKVVEPLAGVALASGCRASVLDAGLLRLQRAVALVRSEKDSPAAKTFLDALEQRFPADGKGFVRLARPEEGRADLQVAVQGEVVELWDPAGATIPNLRPALKVTQAEVDRRVYERLVHLARYENVRALENRDAQSPLAGKLEVELLGVEDAYDPVDGRHPQPFGDPGATPELKVGQTTFLRIRNGAKRVLNVTVLDLQPGWGIEQIYPAEAGAFEPLDPGQEAVVDLKAVLPEGYASGTDLLKVFATVATTDFKWLTLPTLDQPEAPRTRSAAKLDPLAQLFAEVAADAPRTRGTVVVATPSQQWACADVELRIRR